MSKSLRQPLVSVVITCYNYAEYVGEAIESVLRQTYGNIELIVIDDGSTDNSLEIIREYGKQGKVKIVSRVNRGIVYTRNEGIDLATGDYLCFLDADDYFDSNYIEKMVETAEENGSDVVYPNWRVFGDKRYIEKFSEFSLQKLITQEIHCTSESLVRHSSIGGHRFESEEVAEDWDFFLGLALRGKTFTLADDCYINYRVRSNTRATTGMYWDNMRHFVGILEKWKERYPEKVTPLDLPVYAGTIRDNHIKSQDDIINQKDRLIIEKDKMIDVLTEGISNAKTETNNIINSRSYKIARAISLLIGTPIRSILGIFNKISLDWRSGNTKKRKETVDKFAVVIHLFYLDNWPLFKRKLSLLPKNKFDLYITIPKENLSFVDTIKKDFPGVDITVVKNRGRDVLPFMITARKLYKSGYKTVLKFHSKKSTHRDDGQDWLESMLDQIVPEDKAQLDAILNVIKEDNFGLVGPASVYYPLTVNFPANGVHMTKILRRLYGRKVAQNELQTNRKEYGFFGGTMFWINISKISNLINLPFLRFEKEAGQIDGTLAHALERLFCLVPEISGSNIYEADGKTVRQRDYRSENIPEWSEDHDK